MAGASLLALLDDRYVIWGYSGWTRTRCDLYRIKEFDEDYGPAAYAVLDEVRKLPLKVAEIYRKLTI